MAVVDAEKDPSGNRDLYSYEPLIPKPGGQVISIFEAIPNHRADVVTQAKKKAGDFFIVRSIVNRFLNDWVSMEASDSLSDSTIRAVHWLEYVNRYFPDVLSGSVLRHFRHEGGQLFQRGASVEGIVGNFDDAVGDNDTLAVETAAERALDKRSVAIGTVLVGVVPT